MLCRVLARRIRFAIDQRLRCRLLSWIGRPVGGLLGRLLYRFLRRIFRGLLGRILHGLLAR